MNRNTVVMAILASCLFVGNACGADWKFYDGVTTGPDNEEVMFYDAESIANTNGSTKLWIKIVLAGDIKKCLKNKSIAEKAAAKVAKGYIAPVTKIDPKITDAAYLEGAANEPATRSKAEVLYQMVCSENKIREISGMVFNKNKMQRLGITQWELIPPKSSADTLAKIVCTPK